MPSRKRPLDAFSSAAQGFGIAAPQMAVGELCDDGGVDLVGPPSSSKRPTDCDVHRDAEPAVGSRAVCVAAVWCVRDLAVFLADRLAVGHNADKRVAEISRLFGSAPLLSLRILLISSFCFFSSWAVKSLHFVSPPVLMTSEAEHPLNSSTLRRVGLTVVVISHDFAGLGDLCPRVLHLRAGTLESATMAGRGSS